MSEPSSFAYVTRSIAELLRPSLPAGVEVTSQPVSRAGRLRRGSKGRVNVWLYRIEPNIPIRNLAPRPVEIGQPRARTSFELHYLLTAFANPTAAAGPGAEQWLEVVIGALDARPVLSVEGGNVQVVYDSVSLSELTALWLAAKAEFQISAAYVARGVTITGHPTGVQP
jgi:hypothetical protein